MSPSFFSHTHLCEVLSILHRVLYCIKTPYCHREARDERQIGPAKDVLNAYRKDQTYRETKMRLLHRLEWIDRLSTFYNDGNTKERQWFKGYHVYKSKEEVIQRFRDQKTLSCFSEGDDDMVHVAINVPGQRRRGEDDYVSYLRIQYCSNIDIHQDTGVHFCKFELSEDVKRRKKIDLQPGSGLRYALMLPLLTDQKGSGYTRFTLVYWDWEVLTVKHFEKKKGRVGVENELFKDVGK